MGEVDSLAYAKKFIRLRKQAELIKAYDENKAPEVPQDTDIDITIRILQEMYAK